MSNEELLEIAERIEKLPLAVTCHMDPRTLYLLEELRKYLLEQKGEKNGD